MKSETKSTKSSFQSLAVGGLSFAILQAINRWGEPLGVPDNLRAQLTLSVDAIAGTAISVGWELIRRLIHRNGTPPPPEPEPKAVRQEDPLSDCRERLRIASSQLKKERKYRTAILQSLRAVEHRLEVVRLMLFCGLVLAFFSLITTLLWPPARISDPTTTQPVNSHEHAIALLTLYALVGGLFGVIAARRTSERTNYLSIRVGGLAALYVNGCTMLIAIVYSKETLFGPNARNGPFGIEQLGLEVLFIRVALLPTVSALACGMGAVTGRWALPRK